MKMNDYDTLNDIVSDLDTADIESLTGFVDDCRHCGAKKTAQYVSRCIKQESDPRKSFIRIMLNEDMAF